MSWLVTWGVAELVHVHDGVLLDEHAVLFILFGLAWYVDEFLSVQMYHCDCVDTVVRWGRRPGNHVLIFNRLYVSLSYHTVHVYIAHLVSMFNIMQVPIMMSPAHVSPANLFGNAPNVTLLDALVADVQWQDITSRIYTATYRCTV